MEELAQPDVPLPRPAKRKKTVALPGFFSVAETSVVMTGSGLAVETGDLPLSEMTDRECFRVLDFALAKQCNLNEAWRKELEKVLGPMDRDMWQGSVDFGFS